MSTESENAMKARDAQCAQSTGIAGELTRERAAPSFREQIADQLRNARNESRKADDLEELGFLLDRYPDFARMLDLLDKVR